MKSLKDLWAPRTSVFDKSRRDVVLDITDLAENKFDPDDFCAKNYLTDGMKLLLGNAFLRFERKSHQGLFRLAQAMDAGKSPTMLTLGSLAKNPKVHANYVISVEKLTDVAQYSLDEDIAEVIKGYSTG
jgi:predicted AAA+ superfamily ATPase